MKMGRGNVSVSGPYEGVFFVDRDNTDWYVLDDEPVLKKDLDTEDFACAEYDDEESNDCFTAMCSGIVERIAKRFPSFREIGENVWIRYADYGCDRRDFGVVLLENDLFVISVEDNEWSYAVLLLQKQDAYDYHLLGLQKRHYQKYLAAIKEAILDMYGEVGIYTGPWTSGIERRTDRAS